MVLLRGGVCSGKIYHNRDIIFGPALVTAHKTDESGAPPRIIIDAGVFESDDKLINEDIKLTTKDPWDGSHILHFLEPFERYNGTPSFDGAIAKWAFEIAYNIEIRRTDSSLPASVRWKWKWFQDYWNQSINPDLLTVSKHYDDWEAEGIALMHRIENWRPPVPGQI